LHKLGHRIHAEQWQEPSIQLIGFLALAGQGQLKQLDGLARKGIHQSGDPAGRAGTHCLHQHIVHADEDLEPIAQHLANGHHPAHIRARLFDRLQVLVLGRKLREVWRQKVGLVSDRVVVEHAGQAGGPDDRGDVLLHLAPVG